MQIDLYAGPPWGFRITHDQELRPVIGQLIPGGRADVAGLKIGDLIRKIGIISVGTCQEAHSLVHATSGKLTLLIERNPSKYHETVRREKLSTSVQNSPRNDPRKPISSVPNSPRQIRMDMMTGSKNSTDMKRRLFEDLAEDNSPSMVDHLLKKKIEMGQTSAPSSIGYDSVAPDFAGSRRSSRRSTSSSSSQESKIVLEEDEVTILENFEGGERGGEMQDIYNQNVLSHPNSVYSSSADNSSNTNQWSVRTQHNNNIMPAQGDIEVPERRGVAALRQVINDRLEMKTPVGGASASRPKTPQYHQLPPQPPQPQQPAWAANVKVYEPNGFHDPHANKHNMGRVLDGPADPTKYFQGVPPPSFSLTGVKSTPPPPPTHAKPPAPRTSTTIRLPPDMSQHNFRPTTFVDNSHDDLDDGASMISSCISTFGESSEVAALSAAGSQRYLYDQYRRGLLNEKSNVIPEEMSTSITSTKSEITAPSSLFNTDIQLTPFGQSDKPRGRSSSMDLESSELLIKSKSPAPYTSQTADHFGTIRRRHTPVKMDVPTTPTPSSEAPAPVEQRNYDSGYEGSNAISPEQTMLDKALSEAFELASSLSSSINLPNESFMTPSSSSLNNERPESFISSSSSHSHTPRPSQQNNVVASSSPPPPSSTIISPPAPSISPSSLGGSSMPKRHEPEMSQWYRQMFKQMHKPGTEINENSSTMRGEHLDLATISQGRVTPQKVEVDIEPRRARSVGRVIEPEANEQKAARHRFALERSKTAHFHLPSYKFQHEDPRPIRCSLRKCEGFPCMMCGRRRKDPSFEDVDRVYMELEKNRFREEKRVQKRMELRQVTDKLDETTRELDMFIESLQKTWQRSKSQPAMRLTTLTSQSSPSNLAAEIEDLKRISREEVLLRQKAEKLTDELQKEKERRHAYIPSSAAPSLHNNMDRFEGLVNNYSSSRAPQTQQHPQHSTTTATVIYRFDGRSNRELSLMKGDIVRIIREVDSHWLEGERNGRVGIFPASYVQIESEYDRSRQKMRAIYPFTSRNSNELSLKKGEIVTFRREIDQNWMEGTNQIGTIGIFPSSYVRLLSEPKEETVIPDRPKTPKINHEETPTTHKVRFEEPRIHQYQEEGYRRPQAQLQQHQSVVEEGYRRPQQQIPRQEEDYRRPQPQQKYEPVAVVEKEVRKPEPVAVVEKPRSDFRNNAAAVIPKGSEMYRAAFAYRPQKEDELELFVNDIIFVVEKCDDGWFIGTSLRTGDFGIFPGNYVQRH